MLRVWNKLVSIKHQLLLLFVVIVFVFSDSIDVCKIHTLQVNDQIAEISICVTVIMKHCDNGNNEKIIVLHLQK